MSKPKPKMSPRPAPDAAALDAFVRGGAASTPAPVVRPGAKPSKLRRASRGVRVPVYLPPEMEEALRERCAKAPRRSVSDAVTEAVGLWLSRPLTPEA